MARSSIDRDRPDDYRTPDFEFCVHGRPVSAQAHNRQRLEIWRQQVKTAAINAWPPDQTSFGAEVELRITHQAETRIADTDNLTKPIQDALQGVAYPKDGKVDHTGNWRDINASFRVRHMSLPLASAFSDGREFVHIRVWRAATKRDLG
jgi:crossover junction endodeoxyribonuclease RusA